MKEIKVGKHIDIEYVTHKRRTPARMYEQLQPLVIDDLTSHFKASGEPYQPDPILETKFFNRRLKTVYYEPMYKSKEQIVELFKQNGILFRLYSIDDVFHDLFTIGFMWNMPLGTNIFFSCKFPPMASTSELTYQCSEVNFNGDVIQGDVRTTEAHTFEEQLQPWFLNALRSY